MERPTEERLSKLPVWALDYLGGIERERDAAVRRIEQIEDNETPSKFYYEDLICDGRKKKGPTKNSR